MWSRGDTSLPLASSPALTPRRALTQRPWVLHEWLGELPLTLAYGAWRLPGVALAEAGLALVLVGFVYRASRRRSRPLVSLLVAVLTWIVASGSISPRPQVISFLFIVVIESAWLSALASHRVPWWTVPLMWVWACSHGMWVVGLLVSLLAVASHGMHERSWTAVRRFAPVLVAQALAVSLTPLGLRVWTTSWNMRPYTRYVTEWAPPSLFTVTVGIGMGALVVIAMIWFRRRGRPSIFEVALWVLALVCVAATARTVAVGAVLMAPPLASALESIAGGPFKPPARRELMVYATSSVLMIVTLAPILATSAATPPGYPSHLSAQLQSLPKGTVLLNDYAVGGWLLLEHPTLRPIIDGRADVYDVARFEQAMMLSSVSPGWEEVIASLRARTALLKGDSPLALALRERLGWQELGAADGFVLLRDKPH